MSYLKKIAIFSLFTLLFLPGLSFAATGPDIGLEYGAYSGLELRDPRLTAAYTIRTAFSLIGIVFLVIVLGAGFLWMTAGGNEDKISQAKKWIFAGVIGLVIMLSAYAIATFIIRNALKATSPQTFGEPNILEDTSIR